MQVSLRNFRCHESFDVDFAPNSLTLLQGDTGAGKSTVLQAVAWALFGRRFVSNVDPAAKKNARTSVKITTPTHVVYRQKSPGLLRVTVLDQDSGSTVLENESAQAEISRAFGSEEVWLASSYIMQDTRGSFLAASNAERMDLLYKLTFSDENPNDYLELVEREFLRAKTSFEGGCRELSLAAEAFSQAAEGLDFTAGLGPEEMAALRQRSAVLRQQLLLLRQRQDARQRGLGALRQAEKDLEGNLQRLSCLAIPASPSPAVTDPSTFLAELTSAIGRAKEIASSRGKIALLAKRAEELRLGLGIKVKEVSTLATKDLSTLATKDSSTLATKGSSTLATERDSLLQEELGLALAQEKARAQAVARAAQLKVIYCSQALTREKERLSRLLAAQPSLRRAALRREMAQRCAALEALKNQPAPPPWAEKISQAQVVLAEIEVALRQAEEAARLLRCPHCQGALRWKEGTLEGVEEGENTSGASQALSQIKGQRAAQIESLAVLTKEARRAQAAEAEREKSRLRLEAEIESLARQEKEINYDTKEINDQQESSQTKDTQDAQTVLTQPQETEARRLLASLEALEIVEAPAKSSQLLRAELEYWRAVKESEREEERLALLEAAQPERWRETPALLEAQRRSWEQYLGQKAKAEGQKQELSKSVQRLEAEIIRLKASLPADALAETAEVEAELAQGEEKWRLAEKIERLLEEHGRLEERRERLTEEAAKLEALTLFRERSVQVACAAVQSTVDSINASMENIVETIFDTDIRIQLQLSREVKSTGRIKHEVSFNVGHQGAEFDTLARLSGGEGDRASLALCISLNKLSGCPFLMFDETMRSLNDEKKERVLEALRENACGKTVIFVVHGVVEGLYDHVVRM